MVQTRRLSFSHRTRNFWTAGLFVAYLFCQAAHSYPHSRNLLTGFSYGKGLIAASTLASSPQQPDPVTFQEPAWAVPGGKTLEFVSQQGAHHRGLLQTSPSPAPAAAHGVQGQPSSTTVYTIVNNNQAQFGNYVCIDACAHGNTCIWQNAWLWQCNGTNPTHHYWVWEPDSLIIRSATTDSFQQNPEICLDMCTDTRYGNAACAVTAQYNKLNVGFKECTGASNQQFELKGLQIVNKYNGYCVSAGPQSCGRWSNCNKAQAQTRQNNMILNVFAEPCDTSNVNQQWTLGPAPNSTLIQFTPLNVSATRYAAPVDSLAADAKANSKQVVNFVNGAGDGSCLSIENQASCQSSQEPGTSIINDALSTVCVWKNALLQTCWTAGSDASADQQWVYDNSTKLIALATDPTQNVCLELCVDNSFANGACSLTNNNVGFASCTGAPEQQWIFTDGFLYNEAADMCITEQQLCMADYQLLLDDPAAASRDVNGYLLSTCLTNIKNGPWAGLPYNGTQDKSVGIRNLIGGPCDQLGNGTVLFTATPALQFASATDPTAPGITASTAGPAVPVAKNSTSTGAIVGGVVGGVVGLSLILGLVYFLVQRRKQAKAVDEYSSHKQKEYAAALRGQNLNSVDSDVLAPARSGGLWLEKLDLGDEMNPNDIEIAQKPDGSAWKLGEGAFGTVYKGNRFGVQPIAVKVLREDSGKQIENFKREIEMLRGLRDNNIVLFLGACKKDGQLMLVTEYMPQGDLWNALNQANAPKFQWYQRGRKIALDVARGLVHLHSRGIVHMDLKSPNILLGKDLTAKIADVGLARSINNSYLSQMTSIGTMAWAAPELTRNFQIGRQEGSRSVTAKADVFSFGVVLWEVVTGEDPTNSSREVSVPDECPVEIEALLKDCLATDPQMRPDMKAVFERLRAAANVPPPGATAPLQTPSFSPPLSSDGSAPRSTRSAPRSGDIRRVGLAAALRSRLGSVYLSGGSSRSAGPPKSSLHVHSIKEEPDSVESLHGRDDSAEEKRKTAAERLGEQPAPGARPPASV